MVVVFCGDDGENISGVCCCNGGVDGVGLGIVEGEVDD